MRPFFILTAPGLALVAACASLPSLVFETDDAGVDASSSPADAGMTAPHDASRGDAIETIDQSAPAIDAGDSSVDAPTSSTCPGAPPPDASTCCGAIPCNGTPAACAATCTNCENDCNVGQTCCLDKNGNFAGCSAVACP